MKKIQACLLAFLCLPFITNAQAIIKGQWNRSPDNKVHLMRIEQGNLEEIAVTSTNNQSNFGFAFYPEEEGFYVIGTGDLKRQKDMYPFYFKNGDELNVIITDTSYILTGKNTFENKALEAWHNMVIDLERLTIYQRATRKRFGSFPSLFEAAGNKIAGTTFKTTGNKTFDKAFTAFRELDLMYYASLMLLLPDPNVSAAARTIDPRIMHYFKNIDLKKYTTNSNMLHYYAGNDLLSALLYACHSIKGNKTQPFSMADYIPLVVNDTLKGEAAIHLLESSRTYEKYITNEKQVGKYLLTEYQTKKAIDLKHRLANEGLKPGYLAMDFSGNDTTGKKVSLSDFKGKVVVIDVWATWCKPCIGEIPHLKKLEQEMHGQDIVFMSVSVDKPADLPTWKKFIATEKLSGVQIISTDWEISRLYDVKSIPRFIVIGKDGRIVSANAPRPSGDELKGMLLKAAAK